MANKPRTTLDELVDSWLACAEEEQQTWLTKHSVDLGLPFLECLKQRSDQIIRSAPKVADTLTRKALLVAQHCPHEPLAYPLAWWARGAWACYHAPQQAVNLLQQALPAYRAAGDYRAVFWLLNNLMIAWFETGAFESAYDAYQEALTLQAGLTGNQLTALASLTQNYGLLLDYAGRHQEALIVHAQARQLAERLGEIDRVAEIDVNCALTLASLGRLTEVEALLQASRAVAVQHQHHLTVARLDMNLGDLYAAQGQPAQALRRLQAARSQFQILGNGMEVGSVLMREATLFTQIGAFEEGRRCYAQAQTQFAALQMLPQVGFALLQGAQINRQLGEYRQAKALLQSAETIWTTLTQAVELNKVRLEKIALALAQQDSQTAYTDLTRWFATPPDRETEPGLSAHYNLLMAETFEQQWHVTPNQAHFSAAWQAYIDALHIGRTHSDPQIQRQALIGLGRLAYACAPSLARTFWEQALVHDELIRQSLSVEELKSSFQQHTSDLWSHLLQLTIAEEKPEQTLRYAWQAKGIALLELLDRKQSIPVLSTHRQTEASLEIERIRQELAAHRWRATQEIADNEFESELEQKNPTIRHLSQQLQELRRHRNEQFISPIMTQLQQPTQLLQNMEADLLIEYITCNNQILAICANREGQCRTVWLADVDAILDLLGDLQLAFQNVLALSAQHRTSGMATWLAECQPLLARGHALLLAPLGTLPPGGRLLIALCEPLYTLPFAAFWDGQHYLVETNLFELTPSGALLAAPAVVAQTTDPMLIAATLNGKLPATQTEVEMIQTIFPTSTCWVDQADTIRHLVNAQISPRFLHLAAHTRLRTDTPIFTALQLTGELLAVEQCYELPLRGTELVTLSSCQTTAGMETGGALLAFQSAFFTAGAHRVLTTLWPAPDSVTMQLMAHFYLHLAQGMSPPVALRNTQLEFMANPETCHPALWAAFTCNRR